MHDLEGWDRESYARFAPQIVSALRALGEAVEASGLEKDLIELLKIRVSQINGCAFCVAFHSERARQLAVTPAKLDGLAVWRDAGLYSPREMQAFEWAEALTRMGHDPRRATRYAELARAFSRPEIAALTAAIGLINAWNRIAGGLDFPVPGA